MGLLEFSKMVCHDKRGQAVVGTAPHLCSRGLANRLKHLIHLKSLDRGVGRREVGIRTK